MFLVAKAMQRYCFFANLQTFCHFSFYYLEQCVLNFNILYIYHNPANVPFFESFVLITLYLLTYFPGLLWGGMKKVL